MLVTSRCLPIRINNKKTAALIPLADMINHDDDPNCERVYNDNDCGFKVVARKKIA